MLHILVEQQHEDIWRYTAMKSRKRRPRPMASYSPHVSPQALPRHRHQLTNSSPMVPARRMGHQYLFSDRLATRSVAGLRAMTPHYHLNGESEDENDLEVRDAEDVSGKYRGHAASQTAYTTHTAAHRGQSEDSSRGHIHHTLDPPLTQVAHQDSISQPLCQYQSFFGASSVRPQATAQQQQIVPTETQTLQPVSVMMISEQTQPHHPMPSPYVRLTQPMTTSSPATSMPPPSWTPLRGSSLFSGGPPPGNPQQQNQNYPTLGQAHQQPQPQPQPQQVFHQPAGARPHRQEGTLHQQESQKSACSPSSQA